jgi:hypothetical protein
MSSKSNIEYLVVGGLLAGGLLLYADQKKKQPLSENHRRVETNVQPPPVIRSPAQGNGLYGYFNAWLYQGRQINNHALDL